MPQFNFLTEEQAKLPFEDALIILALHLKKGKSKTKYDFFNILLDAYELGRRDKGEPL